MNRRSFIGSILALGVAPAIVRADSLMRIVPREMLIIPSDAVAEYFHHDTGRFLGDFYASEGRDWREGVLRIWADGRLIWTRPSC